MAKSYTDEENLRYELGDIIKAIKTRNLDRYGNFKAYQDALMSLSDGVAAFEYPDLGDERIVEIQNEVLRSSSITMDQVSAFLREVTRHRDEGLAKQERIIKTSVTPPFRGGMIAELEAQKRKK